MPLPVVETATATALPEEPPVAPTETPFPTPVVEGGVLPTRPASEPQPTPQPPLYMVQGEQAFYLQNPFKSADNPCAWFGVAGLSIVPGSSADQNRVIVLEGNFDGQPVHLMGLSGLAADFGPSGYQIQISDHPGRGIFWIQLFDLNGTPLSDVFTFTLQPDCSQNTAMVSFIQVEPGTQHQMFLPLIQRNQLP